MHLHHSIMHGFHLTYFHKIQNSAMPLCEDMLHLISHKSVKKCEIYRPKFMHCLKQNNNKSRGTSEIQINYEDKQISIANETKFPGLSINNLSWKTHTECTKSKLSSASYAMRSVKPYVAKNTLKKIFYSYFHSVMTCGLLFWGNSPDSIKIFMLQKKIIRIMIGCKNCFLTWKFYLYLPNTFFSFFCLW